MAKLPTRRAQSGQELGIKRSGTWGLNSQNSFNEFPGLKVWILDPQCTVLELLCLWAEQASLIGRIFTKVLEHLSLWAEQASLVDRIFTKVETLGSEVSGINTNDNGTCEDQTCGLGC